MTRIAPGLTQHTVVLVTDKQEAAIGLQAVLTKHKFRVITALSIYDALKYIAQEMPHLVVTNSLLTDGTAGTLYDRLTQHPTLKDTPILVHVQKKTAQELAPLKGRKFAGFVLGKLDGGTLVKKINEVLGGNSALSPYFVDFSKTSIDQTCTLTVEATVIGKSGERVVSRSMTEVDSAASLVCVPSNKTLHPAIFKSGSNLVQGEEVFNLFPMSRIRGKGRKWIVDLPEITVGEDQDGETVLRKVIYFDPNSARYEQFKEVLLGYDIDLIYASTLQEAGALLSRDPASVGCVYLHEMRSDSSSVAWKDAYCKVPENARPVVIVGTSSMNVRSTPEQRFIKRPFGLGKLVEMMEAAFENSANLADAVNSGHDSASIVVSYQSPAKVIGLDEEGGILQIKFPVLKGSRLRLNHPVLAELWDGDDMVRITAVGSVPEKPDVWHARFVPVSASGNKVKYWDKISGKLQSYMVEEEPSIPEEEVKVEAS